MGKMEMWRQREDESGRMLVNRPECRDDQERQRKTEVGK